MIKMKIIILYLSQYLPFLKFNLVVLSFYLVSFSFHLKFFFCILHSADLLVTFTQLLSLWKYLYFILRSWKRVLLHIEFTMTIFSYALHIVFRPHLCVIYYWPFFWLLFPYMHIMPSSQTAFKFFSLSLVLKIWLWCALVLFSLCISC